MQSCDIAKSLLILTSWIAGRQFMIQVKNKPECLQSIAFTGKNQSNKLFV